MTNIETTHLTESEEVFLGNPKFYVSVYLSPFVNLLNDKWKRSDEQNTN